MSIKSYRELAFFISINIGDLHNKYPCADADDIMDAFDEHLQEQFKIGNAFMELKGLQKSIIGNSYIKNVSVHPDNFVIIFKQIGIDVKNKIAHNRGKTKMPAVRALEDLDVEHIIQELFFQWKKGQIHE
jgi:hypothetical protein